MKINRYITRGINESIPLDLQILLWHMVEKKITSLIQITYTFLNYKKMRIYSQSHMNKNNPHTNWNITIQTMKNQNALPKKVYVIREDDVDAFLCDAFTRRILKEVTMMNTIKSTIHTEAIFSDDEQHRYLLKKTWDEKKAACTVITMYPHLDGVLSLDLTTVLILNQLANSERYGAVYLVNLFSNIRTPENLKHIKNPYDEHTDIHLMKAISESDTVILAYGAYAKRPVVIDRVEQVMEMLKPHKKKVKSSSIQ